MSPFCLSTRNLLDPARRAIDEQFADDPITRGALLQTISMSYNNLGLPLKAIPIAETAVALRREHLGNDHRDTLWSIARLGGALSDAEQWEEAEAAYKEALDGCLRTLGASHPDTRLVYNDLGLHYADTFQFEQAFESLNRALPKPRDQITNFDSETSTTLNNLALAAWDLDRLDTARELFEQVLDHWPDSDAERLERFTTMNNLGSLLFDLSELQESGERAEEAERILTEAIAGLRRVVGDKHPNTLSTMNNLGYVCVNSDRLDEAEHWFSLVMDLRIETLGPRHTDTLMSLNNLAFLLDKQHRFDEAHSLYRKALDGQTAVLGETAAETMQTTKNLADSYGNAGAFGKAIEMASVFHDAALKSRRPIDIKDACRFMADLYDAWEEATPGEGHEVEAAAWRAKANAITIEDDSQ